MPTARKYQIDITSTFFYHCFSRCVRRAFLCGRDAETGKEYDHRKKWLVERIKLLSAIFAIDICAYAILSNHYHLVLKVDADRAGNWDDREVIKRWKVLFKGDQLINEWFSGKTFKPDTWEGKRIAKTIQLWRERLSDISWYMRCLNEPIARQANKEDKCTGRFWEGRFKTQALMDDAAILSCMMYVDLNPIRAGISQSLERSDFTSIQERIKAYKRMGL